jgi:hypothetical protein
MTKVSYISYAELLSFSFLIGTFNQQCRLFILSFNTFDTTTIEAKMAIPSLLAWMMQYSHRPCARSYT